MFYYVKQIFHEIEVKWNAIWKYGRCDFFLFRCRNFCNNYSIKYLPGLSEPAEQRMLMQDVKKKLLNYIDFLEHKIVIHIFYEN